MRIILALLILLFSQLSYAISETSFDTPLWREICLAMQKMDYRTVARLQTQVSPEDKLSIALWRDLQKNPRKLLYNRIKPSVLGTAIVADTFKLLIHDQLPLARQMWRTYDLSYQFTYEQKQKIYRAFALEYTFINNPESLDWYQLLAYDPNDRTILEWRIRERIAREDWTSVQSQILNLPIEMQSEPCWRYWLARSYMQLNNDPAARALFGKLSLERNYYAFLASAHLSVSPKLHDEIYNTRHTALNEVIGNPLLTDCKTLYQRGEIQLARTNWQRLMEQMDDDQRYWAAKLAATWGWYDQAIFTSQKLQHQNDLQLRFPIVMREPLTELSDNTKIPTAFLMALIRQESSFRSDAASGGGAVGIMQLLPSTAQHFSRVNGWRTPSRDSLLIASTSLKIGTHYLNSLVKQLDGDFVLAAAAYNAGIGRVVEWKKHWKTNDPTIWIENLPWQETRDYVKNIVTFYIIYRHHLNQSTDLTELFSGRVR